MDEDDIVVRDGFDDGGLVVMANGRCVGCRVEVFARTTAFDSCGVLKVVCRAQGYLSGIPRRL